MKRVIAVIVALTAALVVALLLVSRLPSSGVASSMPTETPTAAATARPTVDATPAPLDEAEVGVSLAAGRRAFDLGMPGTGRHIAVELTTQAGWVPQELTGGAVTFAGPNGGSPWLGFYSIQAVYQDPCHPQEGFTATDGLGHRHAADIVAGLRALQGFDTSPTDAAHVGGWAATHFVISNTIDTDASACTDGALLPLFITWDAEMGRELHNRTDSSPATNGGTSLEVWVVGDVNPLVIVGEVGGAEPDAERAALLEIINGITVSF